MDHRFRRENGTVPVVGALAAAAEMEYGELSGGRVGMGTSARQ